MHVKPRVSKTNEYSCKTTCLYNPASVRRQAHMLIENNIAPNRKPSCYNCFKMQEHIYIQQKRRKQGCGGGVSFTAMPTPCPCTLSLLTPQGGIAAEGRSPLLYPWRMGMVLACPCLALEPPIFQVSHNHETYRAKCTVIGPLVNFLISLTPWFAYHTDGMVP